MKRGQISTLPFKTQPSPNSPLKTCYHSPRTHSKTKPKTEFILPHLSFDNRGHLKQKPKFAATLASTRSAMAARSNPQRPNRSASSFVPQWREQDAGHNSLE